MSRACCVDPPVKAGSGNPPTTAATAADPLRRERREHDERARAGIAALVMMVVGLGWAPLALAAEPAMSPAVKRMQEQGATIIPLPELKRRYERLAAPPLGFTCSRSTCSCSGVEDCLDMIHSHVCSPDSDKFNCSGAGHGKVTCKCSRH